MEQTNAPLLNKPPQDSFWERYGAVLSAEGQLNIFVGSGSGLLIRSLLKHAVPNCSFYIFIETDRLAARVKPLVPEHVECNNIKVLTLDECLAAWGAMGLDKYIYHHRVTLHDTVGLGDGKDEEYQTLTIAAQVALENKHLEVRSNLELPVFINNQLDNILDNRHPAQLLHGKFKDRTCVVLAGGPTLDESIAWVKQHQDNLIVMAISRIARRLLEEGIIPHIVFSIDPRDVSFDVSKHALTFPSEVLFICAYHVIPKFLSQWHGRSLYLGDRFPWRSDREHTNIMAAGPTVTHAAFLTAIEMGFSRVLLAGVDLCFTEQGITHESASDEAAVGGFLGAANQWVETYGGHTRPTSTQLSLAAEFFEKQTHYALSKGVEVISLSPNGRKLDGCRYQDPDSIELKPHNGMNIWAQIHECLPAESAEALQTDRKLIGQEFTEVVKNLTKIISLSKDALKENKLILNSGPKAIKHKKKLQKIKDRIEGNFESITPLIKRYGIQHFLDFITPEQTKNKSAKELERKGASYFNAFIKSSNELKTHIHVALERVKARTEETKPSPDFSLIIDQWQKDNQPGRADLWLHKNAGNVDQISPENLQRLNALSDDWCRTITNKSPHRIWLEATHSASQGLDELAIRAYRQNNFSALQAINETLHTTPDKSNTSDLKKLTSGLMLLLDGRRSEALEKFNGIHSFSEQQNLHLFSLFES